MPRPKLFQINRQFLHLTGFDPANDVNQRFEQAANIDTTYGGAEANALVALSKYGFETEFITRLPDNDIGNACGLVQCGIRHATVYRRI